MTDASGTASYKYDNRGRLIQEIKTIDSAPYTTSYTYDGADRVVTITYPITGEVVTNTYNGRGLPEILSGSTTGSLVSGTLYNALGSMAELNLGNSTKTTFGYYGMGGTYDTTGGYYGRLWEIKTSKQPGSAPVLQDVKYTWDAGGNLTQRENVFASETENFTYDFLDRLTGVSGPYSESFSYNQIGNITTKDGANYAYGAKPHAVTQVGNTNYTYDSNGNMLTDDNGTVTITDDRTILWDVENRPVSITKSGVTTTFVYDGDGNRVKQTAGGEVTTYVNKYYEKTRDNVTTNYYLGSKLIAVKKGANLSYIMQDHLGSTVGSVDANGANPTSMSYFSFGAVRTSGTSPTDKKFTGQRLDSTGLYYYNARYYDPQIGRFISPDPIVHNMPLPQGRIIEPLVVSLSNTQSQLASTGTTSLYQEIAIPQEMNRYSYVLNNSLKYIDPTGNQEVVQLEQNLVTLGRSLPPNIGFWFIMAGGAVGGIYLGYCWITNNSSDQNKADSSDNSGNTANADPNGLNKPPKGDFRDKLQKYTKTTNEQITGKQAHHIFPQKFEQQFWDRWRIDVNNPKYGSWVDKTHQNWSDVYNSRWERFLKGNPTKEEVLDFGRTIMKGIGDIGY